MTPSWPAYTIGAFEYGYWTSHLRAMPFTLMLVFIVLPFLVRLANTQLSISKLGRTSPRYDLLPVPLLPVFLNIGIFCVSCSRNSNTPSKYIALLMPRLGIGEIGHFLVTFLCNSTAGQLAVFCSITVCDGVQQLLVLQNICIFTTSDIPWVFSRIFVGVSKTPYCASQQFCGEIPLR